MRFLFNSRRYGNKERQIESRLTTRFEKYKELDFKAKDRQKCVQRTFYINPELKIIWKFDLQCIIVHSR